MNSGVVIHRSQSDDGVVEIIQNRNTRSLYFGSDAKQSSMNLLQPEQLVLSYTQVMMLSLLFIDQPRATSLIGLGGGSLAKFLMHHFPQCKIDAVETRHDVVKLAHGYFSLPDDQRLETYVGDGLQFLSNEQGRFSKYDLMLVDAFNHDGVSDTIKNCNFFDFCYQRLNANGVLTINLWNNRQDSYSHTIESLENSFKGNVLLLPVEDKGNVIAFATQNSNHFDKLSRYKQKAVELQVGMAVEFVSLLRQLQKHNRWRRISKLI